MHTSTPAHGSCLDNSTLLVEVLCAKIKTKTRPKYTIWRLTCGFIQLSFVVGMLMTVILMPLMSVFLSVHQIWNLNMISLRFQWILLFLTSNMFFSGIKEMHTKLVHYTFNEDGQQVFIVAYELSP